jgi:putative flippase GtrA
MTFVGMTLTSPDVDAARPDTAAPPTLDLVVPVHNEATDLAPSIRRLRAFLAISFPFSCRITIADNASTDATREIAERLETELPGVRMLHLPAKGRGRALRAAWSGNDAAVVAYMDVDLSTDLAALLPLVAPLLSGHSDVAIGTRLSRTARVVRGSKRELISRSYNALLRASLGAGFSDAQCGFKAIRTDCAQRLLPLIQDDGWFFDTELLVLAERAGLRIHEVPVDWVDDPDSRVDIVHTAIVDLRGVARMLRDLGTGRVDLAGVRALRAGAQRPSHGLAAQVLRFAGVGALSTVAYLLLYLLLRAAVPAQAANAMALLVTAIGNTAANRRWTFVVRGSHKVLRQHAQGLAVFGIALFITAMSLTTLHAADPHASRAAEAAVLVIANLAATAVRFLALRGWVFRTEVTA